MQFNCVQSKHTVDSDNMEVEDMVYDCVIVGSGPAGLEAALNLKIHNKNFLWLGSKNLSDKIRKAERISNYPGFANISGEKLIDAFQQQMKEQHFYICVFVPFPFQDLVIELYKPLCHPLHRLHMSIEICPGIGSFSFLEIMIRSTIRRSSSGKGLSISPQAV